MSSNVSKCAGLFLGLASSLALAQTEGQIGGLKLAPGSSGEGRIPVPATASDGATEIPVTVFRGAKPGPTLAVLAGFAGTAYGPMAATFEFTKEVKASEMSGTLILVHIANVPAFYGRSVYLNPADRKDLAHSFPGKPDGTSSERIAYALTSEIIAKADYVVVLDSGGMNTMLQPFVYQGVSGDAKLDAAMAEMALAFGINYIVIDKDAKPAPATPEQTALAHGKPSIKVMCGSFGISDGRTVGAMTRGITSLMNLFQMTAGTPAKARIPIFLDRVVTVESPLSGVLTPFIQRGQGVHKGEALFSVSSLLNKNPKMVIAPVDGVILAAISTPPVNQGEAGALIGIPRPGQ